MKAYRWFGYAVLSAVLLSAGCSDESGKSSQTEKACGTQYCTNEEVCVNEQCVNADGCKANTDCQDDETCNEGQCEKINCPEEEGIKICGQTCVNTLTSADHCGDCGHSCGNGTCENGKCKFSCDSNMESCDDGCFDLQTDNAHCGSCDNACSDDKVCVDGNCQIPCESGEAVCNEVCTDIMSNRDHCGSCDKVCEENETCQNMECVFECEAGKELCGSECIDLDVDIKHCGSCDTTCDETAGEVCMNGECKTICNTNETLCGKTCIDLNSDIANCGECGHVCEAGDKCKAGVCSKDCGELLDCNGNCIDPKVSMDYCGASETCTDDKAGEKCGDGFVCNDGRCQCNDGLPDICLGSSGKICTNAQTDNEHCGCTGESVGVNCTNLAGTESSVCNAGICELKCLEGFADCDGNAENGCEVKLDSTEHCGECGHACDDPNASSTLCMNGVCTYECNDTTTLCNGQCLDLSSDKNNCGTCGNKCEDNAECTNGACIIKFTECADGYVTTKVNDKEVKAYCLRGGALELDSLRKSINAGSAYPDAGNKDNAYILMKNIDLGEVSWQPIGTANRAFTGIFIGNGKTISGKLTTSGSNTGFFGYINNATLVDMTMKLDIIQTGIGYTSVGSLVGNANKSKIMRCSNTGTLSDTNQSSYYGHLNEYFGGLIGLTTTCEVTDCSTDVTMTINESEAAGLIGRAENSEITNCSSNAVITVPISRNQDAIGGLIGCSHWSNVTNCTSTGSIDASKNTNTASLGYGGLIGWTPASNRDITISGCSSSVTVKAPSLHAAGGLVGNMPTYDGKKTMNIVNSYATGDVTCNSKCGGLVGYASSTTMSNSHATGNTNGTTMCGGFVGLAENRVNISKSYATGNVQGASSYLGGFAGTLQTNVNADTIYATGSVTGGEKASVYVGGAIGNLWYNCGVTNAYAKGDVSGYLIVGGLIGEMRGSTLNNGAAFGKVHGAGAAKYVTRVGGLVGEIWTGGSVTNGVSTGNVSGESYIGSSIGLVGCGTTSVRNIYGTGTVEGKQYSNTLIGYFDNLGTHTSSSNYGSLAVKNSYYWPKASTSKKSVEGGVLSEASIYPFIYEDNHAVLEEDTTYPLASALGSDWTDVTCKLHIGPGTETEGDYTLPVPKVFGADICK